MKLSSSGSISSCSTDCPRRQRPLKPTAIGSSPGTALSTLHYSCSRTGDKSFRRMANTSSVTSRPCRCNSTPELSTMTELFESELLSDEILNSQISLSSQTCRSSGSTIHRIHPQVNPQNLSLNKVWTGDELRHVGDGTKTGVSIQPQAATIYTSVQSAPTPTTSQVVAVPRARDKKSVFDVHWERRPRFVHNYMWADVESQDVKVNTACNALERTMIWEAAECATRSFSCWGKTIVILSNWLGKRPSQYQSYILYKHVIND